MSGKVIVCDACGAESCWQGLMYCDDYRTAGTREKWTGIELPEPYDGPYPHYL